MWSEIWIFLAFFQRNCYTFGVTNCFAVLTGLRTTFGCSNCYAVGTRLEQKLCFCSNCFAVLFSTFIIMEFIFVFDRMGILNDRMGIFVRMFIPDPLEYFMDKWYGTCLKYEQIGLELD